MISDNDIMQHRRIALLELVQKHARHRDLMEIVEPLVTLLLTDYTTDKQVRSLISYLLQVGETNNPEALITTLAQSVPKHEDTLMTIAEQLEQRGEQRGIQRGRQEALNEMARKMFSERCNIRRKSLSAY